MHDSFHRPLKKEYFLIYMLYLCVDRITFLSSLKEPQEIKLRHPV
jgi:hypothetical protein